MSKVLFKSICFFFFLSHSVRAADSTRWWIFKDRWTERDEQKYSEFVSQLGESGCRSFDQCLKSSANPYRESDPKSVRFSSDCADLPFLLRAYFAWKNGLPFSYVRQVVPVEGGADIRYTPKGNRVTERADVVSLLSGKAPQAVKVLFSISYDVSSAMLRFHPSSDDPELFTDLYPVQVNRGSIRPGTVIYDPNGHVAVVYRVETDGRVLYMDAHPDDSITRGTFGKKFARSSPGMGAGFKNWRPLRLVGAVQKPEGYWLGGRVVGARNAEIVDYSVEQFYGNDSKSTQEWKRSSFIFQGKTIDFYDFIRQSLAVGELKYNPVEELKNMMGALCQDLRDRVEAVDLAIRNGMSLKEHPDRLPTNIYGTTGEWESYSTPSRDARIKTSFVELKERVAQFLALSEAKSPDLNYSGANLKEDLLTAYRELAQSCQVTYTRSDGKLKVLDFNQIVDRLFALSFDPYHCVERRWGESSPDELESCTDDAKKARWYQGEQFLRNQIERTYDVRMDFSLEQLFTPQKGNGVVTPPDVDVVSLLH